MWTAAHHELREAAAFPITATSIEVSALARIRLCRCGAPPVRGPWCWACAQEREKQHEALRVIAWNTADID